MRFWSDDPVRTATPAGHSLSVLTQLLVGEDSSLADAAEASARLGIALCDAFIACWHTKYRYNLLRPITLHPCAYRPGLGRSPAGHDAAVPGVHVRPLGAVRRRRRRC